MKKTWFISLGALGLGFGILACGQSQEELSPNLEGAKAYTFGDAKQILDRHCIQCHGGTNPAEGISFDNYVKTKADWSRSIEAIRNRSMPPGGSGGPTAHDIQILEAWTQNGMPQ